MNQNVNALAASVMDESPEVLFARFMEQGDRSALEELVRRLNPSAYRVARCICHNEALAEEAVQNAFLKLLSRASSFEDRGTGSFRSWFLCLVTNCARMVRRSERRAEARKRVDLLGYLRRKGLEHGLAAAPGTAEWSTALEHSLASLETRWSTPVRLHFLSGMQQKEVAAVLGVSQQLVSRRIEQGLEALRKRLGGGLLEPIY